jgi:hypothetical protein
MSMPKVLGVAIVVLGLAPAAFAVPMTCASGQTILTSASFMNGSTLSQSGDFCALDNFTFSNFTVIGNAGIPNPTSFSLTLGAETGLGPSGTTLDFGTTLGVGQDIELSFQVSPILPGVILNVGSGSVSELICSVQTTGGHCMLDGGTVLGSGAASTGGFVEFPVSTSKTGNYWVFKDVSGSSEFSQTFVPEPVSFSLMGIGLLGLGLLGRRRFRK